MRRSLMAAISAGVLVVGVGAGVASADPSPECPHGSVGIGVACHETDPGKDNWTYDPASGAYYRNAAPVAPGAPRTQHERLVMVRACVDLRVGRLAGLQTGLAPLQGHDDAVAVELQCQRDVPPCPPQPCPCPPVAPPAVLVPSPPVEVPAPVGAGTEAPPESANNVGAAPAPETVGASLPVTH
jgi:hypothetical protein